MDVANIWNIGLIVLIPTWAAIFSAVSLSAYRKAEYEDNNVREAWFCNSAAQRVRHVLTIILMIAGMMIMPSALDGVPRNITVTALAGVVALVSLMAVGGRHICMRGNVRMIAVGATILATVIPLMTGSTEVRWATLIVGTPLLVYEVFDEVSPEEVVFAGMTTGHNASSGTGRDAP